MNGFKNTLIASEDFFFSLLRHFDYIFSALSQLHSVVGEAVDAAAADVGVHGGRGRRARGHLRSQEGRRGAARAEAEGVLSKES